MKLPTLGVAVVILSSLVALTMACLHAHFTRRRLKKLEMECRQIAHWAQGQPLSVGADTRSPYRC